MVKHLKNLTHKKLQRTLKLKPTKASFLWALAAVEPSQKLPLPKNGTNWPSVTNRKMYLWLLSWPHFLQEQNRFKKATNLFEAVLRAYRFLAEKNPEVYDADVAKMLNNLGNLLSDQNQLENAEEHYNHYFSLNKDSIMEKYLTLS